MFWGGGCVTHAFGHHAGAEDFAERFGGFMGTARLELELTNAAGGDLSDFVRIELFSTSTSNHYQNNVQIRRTVAVGGIEVGASSVYKVMLTPSNYRLVQFFVMLGDGQTESQTVSFPVDPARVTGLEAPAFGALRAEAQTMLAQSEIPRFLAPDGSFRQGSDLYAVLDATPRLKACFLNIVAKSAAAPLREGLSCLNHYSGMIRMEQDRLFIRTHAALREEVQNFQYPAIRSRTALRLWIGTATCSSLSSAAAPPATTMLQMSTSTTHRASSTSSRFCGTVSAGQPILTIFTTS